MSREGALVAHNSSRILTNCYAMYKADTDDSD
jgi:hypothetical protein